jgi:hypothetical protein
MTKQRIVQKLNFTLLAGTLTLESVLRFNRVRLHSPDLIAARQWQTANNADWSIEPIDIRRYFIVECEL